MDTWKQLTQAPFSTLNYREGDGVLVLRCLSAGLPGIFIAYFLSFIIGAIIWSLSYGVPVLPIVIIEIVFICIPCVSIPWLPCYNHLIIDDSRETVTILKKNVLGHDYSTWTFNSSDIDVIAIETAPIENGTIYHVYFIIKHHGHVKLFSHGLFSIALQVEKLVRAHLKQFTAESTQVKLSDVKIPLESSKVTRMLLADVDQPSSRPEFECAADHASIECAADHAPIGGIVYACPECHALLCSACLSDRIQQRQGCPACDRPLHLPPDKEKESLLMVLYAQDRLDTPE